MDLMQGYRKEKEKQVPEKTFPYDVLHTLSTLRLTEGTELVARVMRAHRSGAVSLFLAKQYAGGGFRGVHLGPVPLLPDFLRETAAALDRWIEEVRGGQRKQTTTRGGVPASSPVAPAVRRAGK